MSTRPNPAAPSLVHRFLHWEKTQAQTVYLTQPWPDGRVEDFTWQQVGDQARRMAAHLRSLNLPAGSRIGILGKNSAHWFMADLAIWMSGHVTVPLYPTLSADTAAYVLEHSETSLLFLGKMDGVTDGWNEIQKVIPASLPTISLPLSPRRDNPQWADLVATVAPLAQPVLPDYDTLATILYTSGSTGRPKGVMHSHGNFACAVEGMKPLMNMSTADRMLSYLPLAHVAERVAVESASLYWGFHVYFADKLETFPADLRRARPTVFFSVPRLWTKFYLGVNQALPPAKQKKLFAIPILSGLVKKKIRTQLGLQDTRIALTGSAPLPQELINWYRRLGLELREVYGMSENLAYSHGGQQGRLREGWIGHPYPGVEARIAASGELEVKSPCQMLGYYRQPEKTAEEMTDDGYFKTGDRGELAPDGCLRITGRVKDLFKTSKGKYVVPMPIENRLGDHPKIESACISGASQPQPFALVMLAPEVRQALAQGGDRAAITAELATLLDRVNEGLEDHEKLDYLVVVKEPWTVENGALTPTLKIRRNAIDDRYQASAERWLARRERVIWE
jgi:long-chain acyl-CoA synthetase